MKLKKILLPIFLGATLLMASFVGLLPSEYGGKNAQIKNTVAVENKLLQNPKEDNVVTATTEVIDNLFEITTYDNLQYTGNEQLLMTIKPYQGTVYWFLAKDETAVQTFASFDAFMERYESASAGRKGYASNSGVAEIKAIDVGSYTVYYYIEATDNYSEISSSATVMIEGVKTPNPVEISVNNELSYNGTEQTVAIITPKDADLYYRIEWGEYKSGFALKKENADEYNNGTSKLPISKITSDESHEIKWEAPGTYTIYYYVPEMGSYLEVAGSTTFTIKETEVKLYIDDTLVDESALAGSSYGIEQKNGYTLEKLYDKNGNDLAVSGKGFSSYEKPIAFRDTVEDFKDKDFYTDTNINLGRTYMYEDQFFVSIELYMDNWSEFENGTRIISCTEDGGWNINGNNGGIDFTAYDSNVGYKSATYYNETKTTWQSLSGGGAGWHTIAGSFDGNFLRLYLDGELLAVSQRFKGDIKYLSGLSMYLGAEAGVSSVNASMPFFKGKMRNVYISHNNIIESESAFKGIPTNDVGYTTTVFLDYGLSEIDENGDRVIIVKTKGNSEGEDGWDPIEYTLSYDGKGAEGTMADEERSYGSSYALSDCAFIKIGFKFIGWTETNYTDNDNNGVDDNNGTTININYAEGAEFTMPANDVIIYAVWAPDVSSYIAYIFLESTTGTYPNDKTEETTMSLPEGSKTIILADEAVEVLNRVTVQEVSGLVYDEEKTLAENGGQSQINIEEAGVIVKFYFKRIQLTLTFNPNGENVTLEETFRTLRGGQEYGKLPEPTRIGYSFSMWTVSATGGEQVTSITPMGSSDTTIYAQWIAIEYTVKFDAAGGSVTPETTTVIYDSSYGTLPTPTRLGYEFKGWKLEDVYISSTTIVRTAANHTLVADWEAIQPTVTISADTTEVAYGTNDAILTAYAVHDLTKTYQWYRSSDENFENSIKIENAINEVYIHGSTDLGVGTYYYRCVVTANELSVTSNIIAINVVKGENLFDMIIGSQLEYDKEEKELFKIINLNEESTAYYSFDTALTDSNYSTVGTTETPKGTDAGEYKIYYFVYGGDNYYSIAGRTTVTIDKTQNVLMISSSTGLEYTKEPQNLVTVTDANEDAEGVIYYNVGTELNSGNYKTAGSTTAPMKTDAGEYVIYIYVPGTTNYDEISGTARVKIDKAVNIFELKPLVGAVYNGTEYTLLEVIDSNNDDGGEVYYSVGTELNESNYNDTSIASTTAPKRSGSGVYTVYFYVRETKNYKELSGFAEVSIEGLSTSLTINPNGGYWGGTTENSQFTQSNGVTMFIENPTRAGYTFTGWEVSEGALFDNNIFTFNIGSATLTAQWQAIEPTISISIDKPEITYGLGSARLTAIASHELPITYQWYRRALGEEFKSISGALNSVYTHNSKNTDAGTYEYKCVATANGISTESNIVTLNVNRLTNSFTLNLDQDMVYDGTEQILVEVVDSDGIDGNVTYVMTDEKGNQTDFGTNLPKAINAGVYTIDFSIAESTNYEAISGQVTVTIDKKENTAVVEIKQGLVYNGTEQQLVIVTDINEDDGGDVYYSINSPFSDANAGSKDIPTGKKSETYIVYFRVAETTNYKELNSYVEVTIDSLSTTLTINPNGGAWGDGELTFTRTDEETLTVNDPTRDGYQFAGWTITNTDTGEILDATNIFVNKIYTFDIYNVTMTASWAEESLEVIISTDREEITYSETSATLTATAEYDLPVSYQWYRSTTSGFTPNSSNIITGATKSTYIHSSTEKFEESYYYICIGTVVENGVTDISNEIEIRVNKGDNALTLDLRLGLIYNGTEQILLSATDEDGIEDNIYYSVGTEITEAKDELKTLPTETDAGTYTIYVYVPASEGYKEARASSVVTIAKRDNGFTLNPGINLVYTGSEQVLLEVIDYDGIDNNVKYSVSYNGEEASSPSTTIPKGTDAGVYVINFSVEETKNYNAVSGRVTIEIARAENVFEINANQGLLYTGEAQTLAEVIDSNNDENGDVWYCIGTELTSENYDKATGTSKDLPQGTNVGKYKIYFYVPQTRNYLELKGYTEVEILVKYTTLTINPNGGTYDGNLTETKANGETLTIKDPVRDGFKFAGWEHVGGGTFENGVFTYGASDATLNARWSSDEFEVILNSDSTEIIRLPYSSNLTDDLVVILTTTIEGYTEPAKTGYLFQGWNITTNSIEGESTIKKDAQDQWILEIPAGAYGDIILDAIWQACEYVVTLSPNSGTVSPETITVTYGSTYGEYKDSTLNGKLPTPTRDGYTFKAWYTEDTFVTEITSDTRVTTSAEHTLYAKWEVNDVTVTLNPNGGTVRPETITVTYDSTYGAYKNSTLNGELPTPTRDGYTFKGWYTKNLFDVDSLNSIDSNVIKNSNGTLSITTTAEDEGVGTSQTLRELAPAIQVGRTYTLSFETTGTYKFIRIVGAGGDEETWNIGESRKITAKDLESKVLWFASGKQTSATISNIQIEEGTVATGYEKFICSEEITKDTIVKTSYTHSLCALWTLIDYKATLDYKGGTDQFLYDINGNVIDGTFEYGNYAIGNTNVYRDYGFNGNYSLGANLSKNQEIVMLGSATNGRYKLSAYINVGEAVTIYALETTSQEILGSVEYKANGLQYNTFTWAYIEFEFEVTDGKAPIIGIINKSETNRMIYIDDIKLRRIDDYNTTNTEYEINAESEAIALPKVVKPGYTFLGWNTDENATSGIMYIPANQVEDVTYYAIYKLSNQVATISTSTTSITYGQTATLTAEVYKEGVEEISTSYIWRQYNYSITDENNSTFTIPNDLAVGEYMYCVDVKASYNTQTSSKYISSNYIKIIVLQADVGLVIDMSNMTWGSTYVYEPEIVTYTGDASEESIKFYYNTTETSEGGTEWTGEMPKPGTYYMYAVAPATENYKEAVSNIVRFEIYLGHIDLEYMANGANLIPDDDRKEQTFKYSKTLDEDGLVVSIGASNVAVTLTYWIGEGEKTSVNVNAGEFKALPTLNEAKIVTYNYTLEAENYTTIEGVATLEVVQASVEVQWTGIKQSYTYNGGYQHYTINASIIDVGGNEIDCELTYEWKSRESGENDEAVEQYGIINAGTYTVTASIENANYVLTNNIVEIEVNPYDATITAEDKQISYLDNAPEYTCTDNAFDQFTASYKVYKVTTNGQIVTEEDVTDKVSTLPTGEYVIRVTTNLSTNNYNITYVDGQLIVLSKALEIPTATNLTYNGKEQTVQLNGFDETTMEIVSGSKATDAGNYQVVITLKDKINYTWGDNGLVEDVVVDWLIEQYDLADAEISTIEVQKYTGDAITPKPEITTEFETLVEGVDFTYSYTNNTNVGIATVTITAVENSNYKGTNSAEFTIIESDIEVPTVTGIYVYNGTEQTVILEGFNSSIMEIVDGNKETNAGSHRVEIKLKDSVNTQWVLEDGTKTKDNIFIDWTIEKSTTALNIINLDGSAEIESVFARVGETIEILAEIVDNGGECKCNIEGELLVVSGNSEASSIIASALENGGATLTINALKGISEAETITVTYPGDDNHEPASATFTLTITSIKVEIVIASGEGSATISGLIDGSSDEIELGSDITFTATPAEGYGLIKHVVGANGTAKYNNSTFGELASENINITDNILTDIDGDGIGDKLTIILYFDEIATIGVTTEGDENTINTTFASNYEAESVKYEFANNVLKAFKSSTIDLDITAKQVGTQHYAIHKVIITRAEEDSMIINQQATSFKALNTNEINSIYISSVKAYSANDREVEDGTNKVAEVTIVANDRNNSFEIDGKGTYIVENATVNFVVTETNTKYDFLGISRTVVDKDGNKVVVNELKDQLNSSEWLVSVNASGQTIRTWKAQAFTESLSEAKPLMMERWYEVGSSTRTVEVTVVSGVSAKLVNTDIGYSYSLATDIFKEGDDPLYAGNWKVVIDNASTNVENYTVSIKVYTSETEYTEYGKDEQFTVGSNVTKVVITIS